MQEIFQRIWRIGHLRNSIIFVLSMMVLFRAVAHIPVPGIDVLALRSFLEGNQILGLLNVFSGGTIENFSIAMLGVAPYITASIIFQLLTMVVPRLEEMQKEGEMGQRRINTYTRIAAVPLAVLQAYGLIQLLRQGNVGILTDMSTFQFVSIITVATAGSIFLMWVGELITNRHIGNGVSLLIFAGIISAVPSALQTIIVNYNPADMTTYLLFLLIIIVTIVGVVVISEGQRNIPVHYARQARGGGAGRVQSSLPLRVNTSGVIPIIFAISVLLFPPTVSQFFINRADFLGDAARWTITTFQNQWIYGILYFLLVFGFTYFYTAVIFHPNKIAENLQRQGAFIPGIRPGKETEQHIGTVMNRLVFVGALFLGLLAILPLVIQGFTGQQNLAIGGTSLLIVVSVAIDMYKQIDAQLTMHEYDRM